MLRLPSCQVRIHRRQETLRVQAGAQKWSAARHALCTRQTTNKASQRMRQLLAIKTPFKAHTILANSSFFTLLSLGPPGAQSAAKTARVAHTHYNFLDYL